MYSALWRVYTLCTRQRSSLLLLISSFCMFKNIQIFLNKEIRSPKEKAKHHCEHGSCLNCENHVRKFSAVMKQHNEQQYLPLCYGNNPSIPSLNKEQGLNCTKRVLFTFHFPDGNPTEGVGQPQFCHCESQEQLLWNSNSTMALQEEKTNPSHKKHKYVFLVIPSRACKLLLLRVLYCTCQSPEIILYLHEKMFENNGQKTSIPAHSRGVGTRWS